MKKILRIGNGEDARTRENSGDATRVLQPAYTIRLKPEPEEYIASETARKAKRTVTPLQLAWHGLTDTGKIRDHNEDSFSFCSLEGKDLFVVADGMGGHDAGEVASKMAVETICKEAAEGARRNIEPRLLIEQAVQKANAEVKQQGASKGSNMGTTLSAALVAGDMAYIANVGDSRVYWIENGSITQITQDHSLVAKLVAAGKLTREEARNHPRSNLLYRTIGNDEIVKVDTYQVGLKKGGSLLLCTDGLWGEVSDEDLHRICAAEMNCKTACARLVRAANENGGKDNITAMVVRVY